MIYPKQQALFLTLIILCFCIGCDHKKNTAEKKIEIQPVSVTDDVDVYIKNFLALSQQNNGKANDSTHLSFYHALVNFYDAKNYAPVWSDDQQWNVLADSLYRYLDTAARDGLFKEDYGFSRLNEVKHTMEMDSVKMKDKSLWAEADLLYSNAFMHILQDLHQGRLQPDSMGFINDTSKYRTFFAATLNELLLEKQFHKIINAVQPSHAGYIKLKEGIRRFTDSMDNRIYTYVSYPYKKGNVTDSLTFISQLQKRLGESGLLDKNVEISDSARLSAVIKKYQSQKKLHVDGKLSPALIKVLNNTDLEKFKRVAITLDRYKQLPDTMPQRYIWVNLPAYKLELMDADSVVMESKVICGKPLTPTPLLTSAISDLVIFPTWTVPESIIMKEMLPGLKKNTGYLAKKGLNLLNNKGEMVDPATVNWQKYSKGIPYKIQQGSGDDNALGVIKFNFNNPYSVYLHDTNQRYLFKNSMRALSHGCVRIQQWEKLAYYIIRNDSLHIKAPDSIKYNIDSIKTWIAQKERHRILVKYQFPLFIRYFGCEAVNGTIKFYDDIYDADKILRERFFSQKKI